MARLLKASSLAFLAVFFPLIFLPRLEDAYRLPQLAALALAALGLALAWAGEKPFFPVRRIDLLVFLFFCVRLLSHLASGYGAIRPAWILEQGLYGFVYFYFAGHADPRLHSRLRSFVLAGAGLAAAYGLAQTFGLDPLQAGASATGFGARAFSSLGNPDFWGGYLVLVLPLSLVFWLRQGGRAGLALLILLLVSLLVSQTRGAWIAFAVSLAVLLAGVRFPRRRLAVLFLCGLAALAVFSFPNPVNRGGLASWTRLTSSFSASHQDARGRFYMARVAWHIFLRHPLLGAGGGQFRSAFLEQQGRELAGPAALGQPWILTEDAHQDWLQLAAESGFPALLLFACLYFLALSKLWKRQDALSQALATGLLGFGLHACFHFPLDVVPTTAFFWCFVGIACAAQPAASQPWAVPIGKVLAWGGSALALAACMVFFRALLVNAVFHQGMNALAFNRPAEALPSLRKCVALQPWDARLWFQAARAADQANDLPFALRAGQKAADLDPFYSETWANLGLTLGKSGRLPEAEQACARCLDLDPRSTACLGNLGKIYYLEGQPGKARETYLRGLDGDSSWAEGWSNLAALAYNQGDRPGARQAAQKALTLRPGDLAARQVLQLIRQKDN